MDWRTRIEAVIKKFYNTKNWETLRNSVLREAGYMDQLELRAGRRVPAETVHHIFPREQYPEYELKRWNVIAISKQTHEALHNRIGGNLSPLGIELMLETAEKNNIPLSKLILVIGLPGTGKTTWVKQHLKGGLAYDLDFISAAFRLTEPHKERNEPARKMANNMMRSFAQNAKRYAGTVFVIRTAPEIEEFCSINPDIVVIMNKEYAISNRKDYIKLPQALEKEYLTNIGEIREYCRANDIEVLEK